MTTPRDRLRLAVAAVNNAYTDHQAALKALIDAPVWHATVCTKIATSTGEKLAEAVKALVEAEMMMDRTDD